jgi:hypothetical protein
MLVRIVKNWNFPDIFRQTPHNSRSWDGIKFTEDQVPECDLLVVFNAPHYPINVKCKEKWLFSQESPVDAYQWHKRSFGYFDKVFSFWDLPGIIHEQTSLPWHVNKSYDELVNLGEQDLAIKTNRLSWVTSNYNNKPGHQLRMDLLSFLKNEHFDFDLYGKGFNPIDDKFSGIFPYKYSLAVENYSCNDYWTEKIADCFLSWTIPVYYGCSNIRDYFPKESMILIDPNDPVQAIEIIKKAMSGQYWEKNISALKEARELVLNKYQLFPNLSQKIKTQLANPGKSKWHYIPENTADRFPDKKQLIFNIFKAKLKNLYD